MLVLLILRCVEDTLFELSGLFDVLTHQLPPQHILYVPSSVHNTTISIPPSQFPYSNYPNQQVVSSGLTSMPDGRLGSPFQFPPAYPGQQVGTLGAYQSLPSPMGAGQYVSYQSSSSPQTEGPPRRIESGGSGGGGSGGMSSVYGPLSSPKGGNGGRASPHGPIGRVASPPVGHTFAPFSPPSAFANLSLYSGPEPVSPPASESPFGYPSKAQTHYQSQSQVHSHPLPPLQTAPPSRDAATALRGGGHGYSPNGATSLFGIGSGAPLRGVAGVVGAPRSSSTSSIGERRSTPLGNGTIGGAGGASIFGPVLYTSQDRNFV